MSGYRGWLSLREVDTTAGVRKGAAFRCFKRLEETLQEGRDYLLLHADRDRNAIAHLRSEDRIYASSINVLLLNAATAARMTDILRKQAS